MTQKWNLQDIRPNETSKRRKPSASSDSDQKRTVPPSSTEKDTSGDGTIRIKNKPKRRLSLWAGALIVVLVLAIGYFATTLSKTTLTVTPEFKNPNVNADFMAYPEVSVDGSIGDLVYEIMTLEETKEVQVTATGEEHVEEQAKGIIEIMKDTPGSERLIKNTRFRSPDGLVFRIQESVVVPGAVENEDGTLVPGGIRAEVFADDVGQEYNLSSGVRFDVPGFKESNLTQLYNSIYAESREDFTGGFSGPKFIINDDELKTAQDNMRAQLRDSLLSRVGSEKPADFVVFDDAVTFTFSSLPSVQSGDDLVTIKEKATLRVPLFKHNDLAEFLASKTITTYSGEPVRIRNVDELNFSYTDSEISSSDISSLSSLSFSLIGKPLIVWEYDSEQLREDLAGKSMTAISTVIPGYPGINKAVITGKPFWRRTFPTEPSDIEIVEDINNQQDN